MPSLFSSEPSLKSNWHSLQRDLKSDLKDTLQQRELPTSKSQFRTFVRELEKASNQKSNTKSKSRPMLPTEKGGKRLARVALNEGVNYFSSPSSSSPKAEDHKTDRADNEQQKNESKRGSLREQEEQPRSEKKNQRGHLRQREWAREEKEAEARAEREAAAASPSRPRVASVESCPSTPTSTIYESVHEYPPSYKLATGWEAQESKQETGVVSKAVTA